MTFPAGLHSPLTNLLSDLRHVQSETYHRNNTKTLVKGNYCSGIWILRVCNYSITDFRCQTHANTRNTACCLLCTHHLMARQGRCIFLTGAPEAEILDWAEAKLLTAFIIGPSPVTGDTAFGTPQPTASWQAPKWRSLAATPERKERRRDTPEPEFFSFNAQIPDLDIATKQDFLDHSHALIDNLVSSQLAPSNIDETTLLDSTAFSFASEISIPSQTSLSPVKPNLPISTNIPLTDIKQIPSAPHILSIAPQTVTFNLLCAVISVSQPRVVAIRRRQATMEIQDLLLGDETRAGFSVSFWLPPSDSQQSRINNREGDDLRNSLQSLRSGDVVLVRNVALSVWRSAVYGQSLGRRWARNSTSVHMIEDGAGAMERTLPFGGMGKLARVRDWRDDFVGRRPTRQRGNKGKAVAASDGDLPPDTQPDSQR